MANEKTILKNILTSEDIVKSINENTDILLSVIPEIKDMIGFPHNHPHHHLDVWNHTLLALSLSDNDFETRLCLLLHDIGKPHSYQDEDIRHFKGHPECSSKIVRIILNRLNYDINFINEVCYLVEKHDTPIILEEIIDNPNLEYKRYKIQYCDALAHNPNNLDKRKAYLDSIINIFKDIKYKEKVKLNRVTRK